MKSDPIVIILNGPSGSGKSTTQKAIQGLPDVPFLSLGVDNLFDTILPRRRPNVIGLAGVAVDMLNPRMLQSSCRFDI